ncbi:MAG: aminopeptidase [Firmicutes bacterium]|uniref:Aminopeptidase n=1 Tax=Candidatus Gallilactobacillus intestinavium TaxID=2840838 RepID=A0A9D9E7A4_9LACO|nr:aminopeptidase [Candidatus Gallilactobacillus intestinavium]
MTLKNFDQKLTQYANLLVNVGVHVQKHQKILLSIAVDQQLLAHKLVDAAYAAGADKVVIKWQDNYVLKQFLNSTTDEMLTKIPSYIKDEADTLMNEHYSRITILSEAPDSLSGVDAKRLAKYQQALSTAQQTITEATINNRISWLVAGAANRVWAKELFPDESEEEAYDHLWEAIFTTSRITDDPIKTWQAHINELSKRADWLNSLHLDKLHYQAKTADITIGLAKDHIWEAAGSTDTQGNYFVPNIPTEEVFTAPNLHDINGEITSTKPLSYQGNVLTKIHLVFKDGQIIDASAEQGNEVLQELIKTDAGSRSLGEVALVPYDSPISNSEIIFQNTLYDENASNHLAIGAGYPFNVKNGTELSKEKLHQLGVNDSQVHVDFMVGSADMNIDGITQNGSIIPIFRNGNWAE